MSGRVNNVDRQIADASLVGPVSDKPATHNLIILTTRLDDVELIRISDECVWMKLLLSIEQISNGMRHSILNQSNRTYFVSQFEWSNNS